MVARRSATGSKLLPCELSDAQLLAIGRLIRACAEIEDLVNLYLCNLAHSAKLMPLYCLVECLPQPR
jgi:hypothetical protein